MAQNTKLWYNSLHVPAVLYATTTLMKKIKMKKPIHSLLATIWADLRTISKTIATLQSHVEENGRDYAKSLIIELIATFLGVVFALCLTNYFQQQDINRATTQRLHLAIFESQNNRPVVTDIFQDFSKATLNMAALSIRIKQPDTSMATAALDDPNIVSRLSPYKMFLLALYTDTHLKLNHALNLYHDYTLAGSLESSKNQQAFSKNQQAFSKAIRENAALAAITCDYLQDLLPVYSHEYPYDPNDPYDHKIIQSRKKQIKGTLSEVISETIPIDSWLGP